MSGLDIFYGFLALLSGLGVFIYGMKLMSDSLESVAGNKLQKMFSKIGNNPFIGVGIGLGTTAIIQSSAAVTVMLISFVNSGYMSLLQATTIIYGANIGTTVTAQLVALGLSGIKNFQLTVILAGCAGIGSLIVLLAKKDKVKKIGAIIAGLGMIFAGLSIMGESMEGFSNSQKIVSTIASIRNPLLLFVFGIVFTALIQSSSVVTSLVITMSAVGIISFEQSMYIIVGSNIGTCVTGLLTAIGTCTNAKRVAITHLLFNVIGSVIFLLSSLFIDYNKIFTSLFNTPQTQIAMLHTYFNVVTVIILLPVTKLLVKLASLIILEKKCVNNNEPHFYYIDEHILSTPPLAISQVKMEISHMAEIAKANFDMSINALCTGNLKDKDEMVKNEKQLNFLNKAIAKFLVPLSHTNISERDMSYIGTCYHTVSDLERIGDYAENILEYTEKSICMGLKFSEEAISEITEMKNAITNLYLAVLTAYKNSDLSTLPEIEFYEEKTDQLKISMGDQHILRLSNGTCTPDLGAIYLSLASDSERVADHLKNIALAIKSYGIKKPVKRAQAEV